MRTTRKGAKVAPKIGNRVEKDFGGTLFGGQITAVDTEISKKSGKKQVRAYVRAAFVRSVKEFDANPPKSVMWSILATPVINGSFSCSADVISCGL